MAIHEPSIDFDHHSPDFRKNAEAVFEEMRAKCPVAYSEHNAGYWVASNYDAARRVLSDDEYFTVKRSPDGSKGGKLIPTAAHAPSIPPGDREGAEHDRLRKPLRAPFARGNIESRCQPKVAAIVDEALDTLLATDTGFDFTEEFSFTVTVETIFEFVGLQEIAEKKQFILMLEDAFAIDPEAGRDREALAMATSVKFERAKQQIRDIIATRRAAPGEDLIDVMIKAEPDLSEDEIVSLTLALLLGGVRTTASSIDNAVWHLDLDPDLRKTLIENPQAIPAAVDELVRLYAPTPLVARTVVNDTELAGITLEADERAAALICSANLDAARFPDPTAVHLDRRDGLHLSFGVGTHFCLGVWLAKMEIREALAGLLRRMPCYQLDRENCRRYQLTGVNNGWATLPGRASGTA